ncbi:MAG: 16S rRNA (adenine(1518)-N(6)/adenine(1519)-N(6))-dimethyltransferase RsmA [Eubacterium sp.]|nr:16S rRNA (adenine(1518)-N(6)/adenine(1519)-N(6))-dimethyltransferase RsmA [Eubacterium sp.]
MNYDLSDYQSVNNLLKKYGFTFSKALGQNFLIDDTVCPRMAQELFADEDCGVLEIGPGIGVLTKELCRCAGKVVAIELDRRLFPVLSETLGDFDNFKLVEGDAMELDLAELIKDDFSGFKSVKVCANLPYYITSPIIMRLLESELDIDEIVVMVQKEAAERLCATPGTRKSGAVTYAVNFYGSAEVLFEVGRESFMPSPNVDSAVIKITLDSSNSYDIEDKDAFFALIKAAFSQRRKTLVNSVSATLNIPKAEIISALESAELDKNVRAEKLTMEEFAKLTKLLQIN